ncbi:MAG: biotin-dependent carboxyltransferase family protein [Flavisolibacter sp.]
MSLKIIKAGLLDTIQDGGRYGAAHLGVGPGGAMDRLSASIANALLGKELTAPVLEMHFPAAVMELDAPTVFVLTGADFSPRINGLPIPLNQPICITEDAVLSFEKKMTGARCYLAMLNEWNLPLWMNSYSTNLKANAGGYQGRSLQKGDELFYETLPTLIKEEIRLLPWRLPEEENVNRDIPFLPGPEWPLMTTALQRDFLNKTFEISSASDRMGYHLVGEVLAKEPLPQLVSSAVGFGTIQWLPSGGFIVLMADHQTTGGYPRVGQVTATGLNRLAQMNAGEQLQFQLTTVAEAEERFCEQQNYLLQLQNTCKLKMENFLHASI